MMPRVSDFDGSRRAAAALAAAGLLAVACLAAAAAPEPPAGTTNPAAPTAAAGGREVSDPPVGDPRRGSLYPLLARLMQARMDLIAAQKEARRRGRRPTAGAEVERLPRAGGDASSETDGHAAPRTAARAPRRWVTVLDRLAAERERVAYAHYMAGEYAEALEHYRALEKAQPKTPHFLLMLALCHRNLGHDGEARALLKEVKPSERAAREWADWLAGMMDLAGETGEKSPPTGAQVAPVEPSKEAER